MVGRLRISTAFIYPIVDWFIPDHIKNDVELVQRVRMFVISHMFGPFLGHPITAFLYATDPEPNPHVPVLGASIMAFWLFPWALKFTGSYYILALISVQNLAFATLWGSFNYGGVSSPFLPWLLMVPLLGFYYLGAGLRFRVAVIGAICVNMAGFYVAYELYGGFPEHVHLSSMVGPGMISIFCAAIYVSLMAVYYANVVASQSELQREVLRHKVTMTELRMAKDAAENANSAKSEFLAKMSHELRTPLNAVIGYSEMLLEDAELEGDGENIADLDKINKAGKHLLALVTDVLDLSKIEAGKMELYVERFDLNAFINDVANTCRPLVAKNANALNVEIPPDLGIAACDVTKLRQAVINLLSNAGKFTRNGQVTLSAERNRDGQRDHFTISVRDTGIGIRQEDQQRLFQNFSQADANISGQYGGTGLGLALSRKLCRLMGGDITVESTHGQGSCFTIQLPATISDFEGLLNVDGMPVRQDGDALPQTPTDPADQDRGATGQTVLVIDDDHAVLELMERILSREGYHPILVDNAQSGLQLARTMRPSLIILDVVMPDMDGWELLAALKSDEALRACPVIVQSIVDDQQTSYTLGADEVLTKPINRERLAENLARLCHRSNSSHPVLVVRPDQDEVGIGVAECLRKQRQAVVEVVDCKAALAVATSTPPAAVLLCGGISNSDALAFLSALRASKDDAPTPTLAIAGPDSQDTTLDGVDHIVDPSGKQPSDIAEVVAGMLGDSSERRHG